MNDISELFWQSSLEDIKRGYVYHKPSDEFICLICGKTFTKGLIYPSDGQLYEAEKIIKVHIMQSHNSPFDFLLNLNKKITGLTDHQKNILDLFYHGHPDNEIAKTLNINSTSTIRNHRFSLREKQKQAKIFLAIMELLGEQIDDRFAITAAENDKILAAYFPNVYNEPLKSYPQKEKKRIIILKHILK